MISVIVPTYRRPLLLDSALRSVANQTFTDVEVIVVNDGGPPVSMVVDHWRSSFPITLVEHRRRRGVSAARNTGINESRGEILAFLDDDDVYFADHLQAAYDSLRKGDHDLVYLGAVVATRRLGELPNDWPALATKNYAFDDDFLSVANFIHTGSVVTRTFKRTSTRFDESLSVCEDWEMWLALRRGLGFRFRHISSITSAYHQIADSSGLVSEGQALTPSPFALARRAIYSRWSSGSDRAHQYRRWMLAFDEYCDSCVDAGGQIPAQAFDSVLAYLHQQMSEGMDADHSAIQGLVHPEQLSASEASS
jgi:glycosyltransferase involved in cell wall biosynthesis